MRFPSFPTIIRAFHTISNLTSRYTTRPTALLLASNQSTTLKASMPSVPFLGSLFSSSSSKKMEDFPVQKNDDEWQAVLNPGMPSLALSLKLLQSIP